MSSCIVHCVAASVVKTLDCCSVRRGFLPCPEAESSESDSERETITAVPQQEPSETKRGNSGILLQHRIWSERRPVLLDLRAEAQGTRADHLLSFGWN